MQVDLARLLLRSQVAALQKFGGLPAQPLASMLGTSGLHTLAEARQRVPGAESAAAGNALVGIEELRRRSSSAAAEQASAACSNLEQWVGPDRAAAGRAGTSSAGLSWAGDRENLSSNLPQQLPNLGKARPSASPHHLNCDDWSCYTAPSCIKLLYVRVCRGGWSQTWRCRRWAGAATAGAAQCLARGPACTCTSLRTPLVPCCRPRAHACPRTCPLT